MVIIITYFHFRYKKSYGNAILILSKYVLLPEILYPGFFYYHIITITT